MGDQHEQQTDITAEDQALIDGLRQCRQVLRNPFIVGFLAVAGVAILFGLGISVGETLYDAFDGNRGAAAGFGVTFGAAIVAIVALGAWLDHRRQARDDDGAGTERQP